MKLSSLTKGQQTGLIVLRVLIGWHFLFEGVVKLYNPSWTAKGYLLSAELLKPFFTFLASESLIKAVDTMNIVGLIVVGALLVIGFKTKWASVGGMALLALYYLAHPPFGPAQGPVEGSYWLVNKNLIEIAALFVLYTFPTATSFGIERLFTTKRVTAVH